MLRILSKIRLLCRYNFCSFYCLVFPWLVFALSPFPPLCGPRGCLLVPLISTVFLFYLLYAVMFRLGRFGRFARFFCPLHTFCLSCQCGSPREHRVCVSAFLFGSLLPCTRFINLLFECASPRKHRVCIVLLSSAPISLAHVLFVM